MVIDDKAEAINALIEAVEAIERELGITPSGVYSDVRVRIDILEARINNPLAPAPNVENPFFIGDDGVSISTGDGYPTENRLPGSLYLRKDGYGNEGLYARRPDGYWHQIDTDPWTANGDLAGNIYSQTVIGFQNRPFRDYPPIDTPAGDGYVIGWNSTDGYWEPQAGFYAFGDLDGDKLNQTIVNLQGTPIVIGAVDGYTDGYTLVWNNTTPQWEPQRLAIVFDPLNSSTTTNLRSNRYITQSPIDNTKLGIINLGNDSAQTTTGVVSDYGVILGGDQNEVSGNYGVIVGGLQNSVTGVLGFIGGGSNNILSGADAVIVGGSNNILSGANAVIVGGSVHNTDSAHSFVGGGFSHTLVSSLFSSILGGYTNSITSTNYAAILSGQSNQIIGTLLRFASILGGASNTINGASDGYLTILSGALNTVDGYYNIIGNGNNNDIATSSTYSSILNGRNNTANGDYNTILNGLDNLIMSGSSHSLVLGRNNSLASNYSTISGLDNTIAVNNNNFVNVYGDNNSINSNSRYSGVWGSTNILNDGYISIFGHQNIMGSGATYAHTHGNNNSIGSSQYVSICGSDNIVGNNDGYSTVFGSSNTVNNDGYNSFICGTNNTLFAGSAYTSLHGQTNDTTTASIYSNVWGSNNTVGSSWATIFGQYGKADFNGQFVHSAYAINGATAGSAQYSRVVLSGSQVSGGQFDLKIPTTTANLALEDGKSYDMSVRILVNNTSGLPTCAQYVFDILAHCEVGILILDIVNITIANDNGTLWTVSLPAPSDNELIIRVDSSGTENRRAVATVEWRELSRL